MKREVCFLWFICFFVVWICSAKSRLSSSFRTIKTSNFEMIFICTIDWKLLIFDFFFCQNQVSNTNTIHPHKNREKSLSNGSAKLSEPLVSIVLTNRPEIVTRYVIVMSNCIVTYYYTTSKCAYDNLHLTCMKYDIWRCWKYKPEILFLEHQLSMPKSIHIAMDVLISVWKKEA